MKTCRKSSTDMKRASKAYISLNQYKPCFIGKFLEYPLISPFFYSYMAIQQHTYQGIPINIKLFITKHLLKIEFLFNAHKHNLDSWMRNRIKKTPLSKNKNFNQWHLCLQIWSNFNQNPNGHVSKATKNPNKSTTQKHKQQQQKILQSK